MPTKAIVLLAHGTRDKNGVEQIVIWKNEFEKVMKTPVEMAWLECVAPSLDEVLEKLSECHDHIVICPLLLFKAGHMKKDVKRSVQKIKNDHPKLRMDVLATLGQPQRMLASWLDKWDPFRLNGTKMRDVLLLGRGGKVKASTLVFHSLEKILRPEIEGRGGKLIVAFSGLQSPSIDDLKREGLLSNVELCIPVLLFDGLLWRRAQEQLGKTVKFFPLLTEMDSFNLDCFRQWKRELNLLDSGELS
jgi:sirohydrochlorin ferrochelatase